MVIVELWESTEMYMNLLKPYFGNSNIQLNEQTATSDCVEYASRVILHIYIYIYIEREREINICIHKYIYIYIYIYAHIYIHVYTICIYYMNILY